MTDEQQRVATLSERWESVAILRWLGWVLAYIALSVLRAPSKVRRRVLCRAVRADKIVRKHLGLPHR